MNRELRDLEQRVRVNPAPDAIIQLARALHRVNQTKNMGFNHLGHIYKALEENPSDPAVQQLFFEPYGVKMVTQSPLPLWWSGLRLDDTAPAVYDRATKLPILLDLSGHRLYLIPPGNYHIRNSPAETLDVPAYLSDPITVEQFKHFVRATGYSSHSLLESVDLQTDTALVGDVTADDALAYARWAGAELPTPSAWARLFAGADGTGQLTDTDGPCYVSALGPHIGRRSTEWLSFEPHYHRDGSRIRCKHHVALHNEGVLNLATFDSDYSGSNLTFRLAIHLDELDEVLPKRPK